MNVEIKKYLDFICVEFGFCLPPTKVDELQSRDVYTADDFVREILQIEGMNPELEQKHFRELKKEFVARFGEMARFPQAR